MTILSLLLEKQNTNTYTENTYKYKIQLKWLNSDWNLSNN